MKTFYTTWFWTIISNLSLLGALIVFVFTHCEFPDGTSLEVLPISTQFTTRFVDLYLQGLSRLTTHAGFTLERLPPILRPFLSKISNAHNIMLCFTKVFSAKDQLDS